MTDDFFRSSIEQMIDHRHPLVVLASCLPWEKMQAGLAPQFAHKERLLQRKRREGRPGAVSGQERVCHSPVVRNRHRQDQYPRWPPMVSENFGDFPEHAPGLMALVGSRNEQVGAHFAHHHPRFNIDEDALPRGAALPVVYALQTLAGVGSA